MSTAAAAGAAAGALNAVLSWPATATRATGLMRSQRFVLAQRIFLAKFHGRVARDDSRQDHEADGDGREDAENQHESVEELAVMRSAQDRTPGSWGEGRGV